MTGRATHLTEAELVDLLDGTLADERRRHADGCDRCAAQAAEVIASAEAAGDGAVPEPPPFFWTQFSARVSEAVANEATKPRLSAFAWARAPWMGAAAVVALAVVWLFVTLPTRPPAPSTTTAIETAATAHPEAIGGDEALDLDGDEAWALVRSLAEDLDEDQMDAQGVSLGAGVAERLALQLTDAERTELARLLQEQLRKSRTPESAS